MDNQNPVLFEICYRDTVISKEYFEKITGVVKAGVARDSHSPDTTGFFIYPDMLEYAKFQYPEFVKHIKENVYLIFGSYWRVVERLQQVKGNNERDA